MRTESYQLPGETHGQFQARQRELRRRRDAVPSPSPSTIYDSSPLPDVTAFGGFDSSSSSDASSSSSDSFSGSGGDFGGGGASGDY